MVPGRGMGAGELAHVVADLESNDGRVAGRATQPILLKGRSFSVWWVLLLYYVFSDYIFNGVLMQKKLVLCVQECTFSPSSVVGIV